MTRYFKVTCEAGASDLHLKADAPPRLRIHGKIKSLRADPMPSRLIEALGIELLDTRQKSLFDREGTVDFAYEMDSGDRFRINLFRQRNRVSLAARRVLAAIPSLEDLHVPAQVASLAKLMQGLVLLVGPTGCGKSTTIAALIDLINQQRACHILTLEDPIEYLFQDKTAFINQREIGTDVPDFPSALKYLLREDPDVVLIGEMRDTETFNAAIRAAETGHLVFGTIHSGGAAETIVRILDLFSPDERPLIRQSLRENLKAVVAQRLLSCLYQDVAIIPTVEIMLATPLVRKMIGEGRESDLPDVIRKGVEDGMQDFNESLLKLVQEEAITTADAYEISPNADELKMRLKGISPRL